MNGGTPAFTSARGYIAEQAWNDSIQTYDQVVSTPTTLEGGGGGPSTVGVTVNNSDGTTTYVPYTQPGWQAIAGSVTTTARVIPDLSFFAGDGQNYSAYLLCAQPSDLRQPPARPSRWLAAPRRLPPSSVASQAVWFNRMARKAT